MEYLLLAIFCSFAGYVFGVIRTIRHLKRMLDEPESANMRDLDKQDIPILATEKHGDMLYLFEKRTDNFMCQGTSLEDLAKKLAEYKDIHIALVDHNSKPIWFVNGEISEAPYEG